jgi:signal transduction histidine kinase
MVDQDRWDALRGVLAGGVATELAEPLARVQTALGQAVDAMDQHVAHAKGPEPLPSHRLAQVREQLAEAYLELSRAVRLASDLAAITLPGAGTPTTTDANDIVERAIALAHHRTGDVTVDLGTVPQVRAEPGRLTQAVAHLLIEAGPTVSVQTRRGGDGGVQITVRAAAALDVPALVAGVVSEIGGSATVRAGAVELRIPTS